MQGNLLAIGSRHLSEHTVQWLELQQTAVGVHPFLYRQCEPIHAASIFPCQDTPTVRFTYTKDFSELAADEHYGLAGMKERTEAMGSSLEVYSKHGEGTQIKAAFQINKRIA
jgi:hypothetical protein